MWLDEKSFIEVTKNSPLVSIDLLVEDGNGRFLLGKRVNKPAQGFWFVPGGRILKNQTLKQAFSSLAKRELDLALSLDDAKLRGVYEHFYDDNFFEVAGFGTHYVVVAYDIVLPSGTFEQLPKDQHEEWAFLSPWEIEDRADVHPSSKAFFR
ncbi:MAG: GDP-mannose mannosyl hydrolase [Hyphomicrobiaceae bacterium]